jgi:phytoene desaturase
MDRIAVIGCGFSGLSTACFLAQAGFQVTVFEKNDSPGGRGRCFTANGFTFDMGPSWYWMPDVFDRFFASFGKQTSDYYKLTRLDPSYRIVYAQDDMMDIPAALEDLLALFDALEPGSSKALNSFLTEGKYKYEAGMQNLVYKPGLSLSEFADINLIKGLLRLHIFQSMTGYIKKFFSHPRLIQLLEFPVLFLGASPQNTPALYSLMNYADISLGTWYPQGGMCKIVEAMVHLASSLGVQFEFNSPVQSIEISHRVAKGLQARDTYYPFDYIVASADYHHVEHHLLPQPFRQYSQNYWNSRVLAPSSLIFYLGINKKVKGLLHHTLFFDQDFAQHSKEIYGESKWPSAPLFYVCCPSKTDNTVAPEGCENIFILIPVAAGLEDSELIREKYFDMVISRLEELLGESVRGHIVFKRSYAHRDFTNDYNSFKGNAYGLANTLRQTAMLKPSIVNNKIGNLFYTGQLTVPGPGVPPSIISGEVVAKELINRHDELVNRRS